MKRQFKLLFALLLLPILVFGNNIDLGKFSKQKEIKNSPSCRTVHTDPDGNIFLSIASKFDILLCILPYDLIK